jgi:tyrosyl-tRNA synthetase
MTSLGILKNFRSIFLLLIVLLSFQTALHAQCDQVFISGKVLDTLREQNFFNLMVVNKSTGRGVFGQPNGHFSVYARPGDRIALSTKGYPVYEFIAKPDENCQCRVEAYIERLPQEVQEIIVRPLKTLEEIKEEREALALRETRTVTGVNVLQSPITALYQAFSKKEQNKRWIAEQQYKDDQRKIVKELLRLYVAFDIIELSEADFDDFITFLNLDEQFIKTASEMELILFIKDKYEHFKRMNR